VKLSSRLATASNSLQQLEEIQSPNCFHHRSHLAMSETSKFEKPIVVQSQSNHCCIMELNLKLESRFHKSLRGHHKQESLLPESFSHFSLQTRCGWKTTTSSFFFAFFPKFFLLFSLFLFGWFWLCFWWFDLFFFFFFVLVSLLCLCLHIHCWRKHSFRSIP